MPLIVLETIINAGPQRCFDDSRSIELHEQSTSRTGERAVGGKTSGLLGPGESVTWRARHLGVWQSLTSVITEFNPPHLFVDEMVRGAFASIRHEHHFTALSPGATLMVDRFSYKSPLGPFGKLADFLFLKAYMRKLLVARNEVIKKHAES